MRPVRVTDVTVRDFRCYSTAHATLGPRLTVVHGPNGAGKTNLLEAVYFGCTGRSCRTGNEREVVRFGAPTARVEVAVEAEDGEHELTVGFTPGEPKRMRVDGAPVERLIDADARPRLSVFLPDRLDLVKGPPTLRRAHLDQFVAAMWPARVAHRRTYAQSLAQRNALLARVRAGHVAPSAVATWDEQLARAGIELMADRARAIELIQDPFAEVADSLGLDGNPTIAYRPRSRATDAGALQAELAERLAGDIDRGFTGHGPHRDEIALSREGRELRSYGSQGQQRLALLALLLAEREVLGQARSAQPVMLLDDVMSELDRTRREALVERLRAGKGQSIITTTDAEHVPGVDEADVVRLEVAGGAVRAAMVL